MMIPVPEKAWTINVPTLHLYVSINEAFANDCGDDVGEWYSWENRLEDFYPRLMRLSQRYPSMVFHVSRTWKGQQFFVHNGVPFYPRGGSFSEFNRDYIEEDDE